MTALNGGSGNSTTPKTTQNRCYQRGSEAAAAGGDGSGNGFYLCARCGRPIVTGPTVVAGGDHGDIYMHKQCVQRHIAVSRETRQPRLLELCPCEGGATLGYQRAGWHVTAVDIDAAALGHNPADEKIECDALEYLRYYDLGEFDAIHASFPCQRWTANGANPAASKYPDLITPGRALLNGTGLPWVMENVPKAPLRRDLILCGSQFGLHAVDTDGTMLYLRRHRVFESNVPLTAPRACVHPRNVQWAGVYGGARKDKAEARNVRHGGYVPPDAAVQSQLLGGVDWMTSKGRRECIPPVYAEHVGRQLIAAITSSAEAVA